jgi:CopG family nickel-responsive transcriptional regulator
MVLLFLDDRGKAVRPSRFAAFTSSAHQPIKKTPGKASAFKQYQPQWRTQRSQRILLMDLANELCFLFFSFSAVNNLIRQESLPRLPDSARLTAISARQKMALTRFSISLEKELLQAFDRQVRTEQAPTRSKAVGDLIRRSLLRQAWRGNAATVGAIILVYDSHRRDLTNRLNAIQHDHHALIIAGQHVHLDHATCLEILAVRGKPADLVALERQLRAVKGVKHGALAVAAAGREAD